MIILPGPGLEIVSVTEGALPCPFCQNQQELEAANLSDDEEDPLWNVICICGTHGPWVEGGPEGAIAAWNDREGPSTLGLIKWILHEALIAILSGGTAGLMAVLALFAMGIL